MTSETTCDDNTVIGTSTAHLLALVYCLPCKYEITKRKSEKKPPTCGIIPLNSPLSVSRVPAVSCGGAHAGNRDRRSHGLYGSAHPQPDSSLPHAKKQEQVYW